MLTSIESTWCSKELGIRKDGVVILVTDVNNNVLVVKEKTNKFSTFKVAGELSMVCETRDNPYESNEEVLRRGIREELGVKKEEIKDYFDNNPVYLGSYPFANQIIAHVYKIRCKEPKKLEKRIKATKDNEIDFVDWKNINYFINPQNGEKIRLGVQSVVKSLSLARMI